MCKEDVSPAVKEGLGKVFDEANKRIESRAGERGPMIGLGIDKDFETLLLIREMLIRGVEKYEFPTADHMISPVGHSLLNHSAGFTIRGDGDQYKVVITRES